MAETKLKPIQAIDNPYKFSVWSSLNTTLTNAATWYKVELNNANFDPNGDFDIVTDYDYTVPIDGIYFLNGHCRFGGLTDGDNLLLSLKLDGSTTLIRVDNEVFESANESLDVSLILELSEGDVITLEAQNVSTAGTNLTGANWALQFQGHLLSVL